MLYCQYAKAPKGGEKKGVVVMKKFLSLLVALVMLCSAVGVLAEESKPVIGISWSYAEQNESYLNTYCRVIEAAGGIPVQIAQIVSSDVAYDEGGTILPEYIEESGMLKQEYADKIKALDYDTTNLAEAMEGVDGVFFVGGEDVSPTLFAAPMPELNNGEEINATRDISDYLLMGYCLDNDIPLFGACRGEQVLGIVSGCQFLQDIPNYYASMGAAYDDCHRMPPGTPNRTYARHDVELVGTDSIFYGIVGADTLENVSSWHHQAVIGVDGTDLTVVSKTVAEGLTIIEGIERPDKTFCLGLQFHPENDVVMMLNGEEEICNFEICLGVFEALVAAAAGTAELDKAA